ncbi:hypothetical protein [Simkania sp.]|uniref:hypothetical protein n=1 Tax=Simkania sp. TaxID=34094 RepID=UPI003B52B0FF
MNSFSGSIEKNHESDYLIHQNSNTGFWDSKLGKITAIALLLLASLPIVTAPITLFFVIQIWTDLNKEESGIGSTFTASETGIDLLDSERTHFHLEPSTNSIMSSSSTTDGMSTGVLLDRVESFYKENAKDVKIVVRENLDDEAAFISDISQIKTDVVPAVKEAIRGGQSIIFIPVNNGGRIELLTLYLGQTGERSSVHMSSESLRTIWEHLQTELSESLEWPETPVDNLVQGLRIKGYRFVSEQTIESLGSYLGNSHEVVVEATNLRENIRLRDRVRRLDEALRNKYDFLVLKNSLKTVIPERLPSNLRQGVRAVKKMDEDQFYKFREQVNGFAQIVRVELEKRNNEIDHQSDAIVELSKPSKYFHQVSRFHSRVEDLRARMADLLRS